MAFTFHEEAMEFPGFSHSKVKDKLEHILVFKCVLSISVNKE